MTESAAIKVIIGALCARLLSLIGHAQGDNNYNPALNSDCSEKMTVTTILSDSSGLKITDDIFRNQATGNYDIVPTWLEYGLAYNSIVNSVLIKTLCSGR